MAAITLDKAYLVAIWLETLLYGGNIVLFCSFLYIARLKHRDRPMKSYILFSAITMFLFSTVNVSLGLVRLIQAFIEFRDKPGGPVAFIANTSAPVNVTKIIVHTANSIIGDSIVVWRCYHVWGANIKICILPIFLIIGSAVSGFGQGIIFAKDTSGDGTFVDVIEHWNGAVFGLSLSTNIIVTSLIAFRVWYLSREFASYSASFKYKRVLALVIESGLIYSSVLIIEITLFVIKSNAYYIIYDPVAQLTGIVPTMIIIMVSLGLTSHDLTTQETLRAETTRSVHLQIPASRKARAEMSTIEFNAIQTSTSDTGELGTQSRGAVILDLNQSSARNGAAIYIA